ncbi:hypothetical protein ABZT34_34535 [Streptomyces sp. NPDC005329]|uniref:hypothetical protein n=1 Tax=Streptomyces sp. NPDC005329 TaxID=3157034 RepID=UPI0033AD7E9B
MIQLLMSPRTARTVRGLIGAIADITVDAVRSVINPAALVADQAETEAATVVEAPDPAGVYDADEMPELGDIATAAAEYDTAADKARAADRAKRKARKLLDRLPAGTYGQWLVRRVASNRQTVDLDAVRAIFKAHGLGDVPMRDNAPSLRVERIDTPANTEILAEVAA